MGYDSSKHPTGTLRSHRRSIRLKDYDYSQQGAYYVTSVAQNRECLFGEVVNAEMILNGAGEMLRGHWLALPERFPNVELDTCTAPNAVRCKCEFVILPNHFHGIAVITDKRTTMGKRATTRVAPTDGSCVGAPLVGVRSDDNNHDPVLGEIVGAWKSITTDEYIRGVSKLYWQPFDRKLWQRNYYEHIIRNEKDLDRIRKYIIDNPANWNEDTENPMNVNSKTRRSI